MEVEVAFVQPFPSENERPVSRLKRGVVKTEKEWCLDGDLFSCLNAKHREVATGKGRQQIEQVSGQWMGLHPVAIAKYLFLFLLGLETTVCTVVGGRLDQRTAPAPSRDPPRAREQEEFIPPHHT